MKENPNLLNIEDYSQYPMYKAIMEVNDEMVKANAPKVNLKVVGGFALMTNKVRSEEGITDIDYVGEDLPEATNEIIKNVGTKHNFDSNWINNDILASGFDLEDMEFSTGKLHFYPAFDLEKISIDVLDTKDLLRLKVIAIDTSLAELDFDDTFTRMKDFEDIKNLMGNLNVTTEDIKKEFAPFIFDKRTPQLIDAYLNGGLEKVQSSIKEAKKEKARAFLENTGKENAFNVSPLINSMLEKTYERFEREKAGEDIGL